MSAAPRLIEGPYLGDIQAQPRALVDTLDWLARPGRWDQASAFVGARPWRRIVLTGMGSSYHTLYPLHLALIAAGHSPVMMETAELLHFGLPLCDEQTLVVAVSQSGGSAETVRLLERKTPARVLGVTNTAGSALARAADLVLLAQAGPEHSVSCKTYVSGMLILQWLAGVLCGQGESQVLQQLAEAPQLVAQCLQGWQQGVPLLAERLRGVRHLFLAGRGPSLAAVATGALIIKEATRVHAEGMSSAAFRHGPIEMLAPDVLLVMFSGDARTAQLNAPLLRDLAAFGGQCERLGSDATLAPLRLPACDPRVLPLLEIVPVQLMTLALASLSGHEAGHFERATKITDQE